MFDDIDEALENAADTGRALNKAGHIAQKTMKYNIPAKIAKAGLKSPAASIGLGIGKAIGNQKVMKEYAAKDTPLDKDELKQAKRAASYMNSTGFKKAIDMEIEKLAHERFPIEKDAKDIIKWAKNCYVIQKDIDVDLMTKSHKSPILIIKPSAAVNSFTRDVIHNVSDGFNGTLEATNCRFVRAKTDKNLYNLEYHSNLAAKEAIDNMFEGIDFDMDFSNFDIESDVAFGDDLFNASESIIEDDEYDFDIADESVATNLRRDFSKDPGESLSLKSMYCVFMNDDALKKYEDQYAQLKEVNKNANKLRGHMYFLDGKLTCFVSIELKGDKTWIDTLHVVKEYRGRKLSHQLLDVAVRKFHATDLKVHKDNERAINIFKTYGFKTYDKKNQWLYMSISADAKSIDDKHTTENVPVTKDVRTDKMKAAGAPDATKVREKEEAKESIFDSALAMAQEGLFNTKQKTVDELLEETRPALKRKLKTVEDCDEYLGVIRVESTKFNEALNGLISAKAKYDKSKKTPADKKIYKDTTSAAIKLLHKNCHALNVKLNLILPGDTKEVSRQDIKRVSQYVQGLRKITNEIKKELKSK